MSPADKLREIVRCAKGNALEQFQEMAAIGHIAAIRNLFSSRWIRENLRGVPEVFGDAVAVLPARDLCLADRGLLERLLAGRRASKEDRA